MSIQKTLNQKLKQDGISSLAASKIAGISYTGFCNIIKGKSAPGERTLPGLAKLLGMTIDDVRSIAGKAGKTGRPAATKVEAPVKAAKAGKSKSDDCCCSVLNTLAKELAKLQAIVAAAMKD